MPTNDFTPTSTTSTTRGGLDRSADQPVPAAHVAESAVVPNKTFPRYKMSVAYLPELFLYLVLLGGLVASVVGIVAESWKAWDLGEGTVDRTVIGYVAGLLVTLPAVALFGMRTATSEHLQSWRLQQKWRRVLYGGFLVIFSLTLVSYLVKFFTALISWALGLSVTSIMPASLPLMGMIDYSTGTADWFAQMGTSLSAVLIIGLVLYAVSREYALSWRRYTKIALIVLSVVGLVLGGWVSYAVHKHKDENCQGASPYTVNDSMLPISAKCNNKNMPDYPQDLNLRAY